MLKFTLTLLKNWKFLLAVGTILVIIALYSYTLRLKGAVEDLQEQNSEAKSTINLLHNKNSLIQKQLLEREREKKKLQAQADEFQEKLKQYANHNEEYKACREMELPYSLSDLYDSVYHYSQN